MKLALGTVQFGLNYGIANRQGQPSCGDVQAILEHAKSAGIEMLDTATAYGESETRLGEIGVADWKVVSKLPAFPDGCDEVSKWVADAFSQSLERLKIRSMYGLLLHRPLQLLEKDSDQLYLALQQLKTNGLVKKIGVSVYGPEELDLLAMQQYAFDIVQAPFNIMDRRMINSGWLSRLVKQGTEVHARSVFLQGLLLMTSANRPQRFERWAPLWAKYENWLSQSALTPLQACLQYVSSISEIDKVIVGVDNVAQLNTILEASAKLENIEVPSEIRTHDVDLLNPAHWNAF